MPCRSPGRPTQAVASGEFSIWAVSRGERLVRAARPRGRRTAAAASYARAVDLERARRHGLPRVRLLPAPSPAAAPGSIYGAEPGDGRRDRAVFSAITVTAPTRHHGSYAPGRGPAGHLDDRRSAVADGEFSIWVVSPATAGTCGKTSWPPTRRQRQLRTSVDLNVPAGTGYRRVRLRPVAGSGAWEHLRASARGRST